MRSNWSSRFKRPHANGCHDPVRRFVPGGVARARTGVPDRGTRMVAVVVMFALMLATFARAQQMTPVPTHDTDVSHQPVHAPDDGHDHGDVQPTISMSQPTLVDQKTFAGQLNLGELRALALQDRQTVKTWDTFARQAVAAITGRSSFDGQEPIFTLLDMAFRPSDYVNADVIRVKNVPLRKDFAGMPGLPAADADRILKTGYVSLAFWSRPEVQAYLQRIQQDAVWKSEAIGQVQAGASLLNAILRDGPALTVMPFVAPAQGADVWLTLPALHGNVPIIAEGLRASGAKVTKMEGYDDAQIARLFAAVSGLQDGWSRRDAKSTQPQVDALVALLPTIGADRYPAPAKRHVEVLYNKLYKLTLPGAALYFVAFVLFIMAAYSGSHGLRRWGVGFMVVGFALHTCGIGIRWWLDQKSTGSWFYSIPIKNQFESVMFSAWFGMLVGLVLEVWKKKSLFGAAASFVGWMSLIALFTVPYVFGKDIGNEIGRVNGILMSYWLYIHVTLATASYALIGMSFLLGVWWLVRYAMAPREVREMPANRLSADSVESEIRPDPRTTGAIGGIFEGLTLVTGLVTGLHVASRGNVLATVGSNAGGAVAMAIDPARPEATKASFERNEIARAALARLDACNLVILQLAFWILAVAIVCGAVWADVSWGRPWGWDPKETFALVTWMVYLVILHVRLVTKHKAFWTAVLTVVGFFIMLFNWIGVNYFLVGLHSYA